MDIHTCFLINKQIGRCVPTHVDYWNQKIVMNIH